jgi:hypothetical protein
MSTGPSRLRRRTDEAILTLTADAQAAAVRAADKRRAAERKRADETLRAFSRSAEAAADKGQSSVTAMEVLPEEYAGDIPFRSYSSMACVGRAEWLLGVAALVYDRLVDEGYKVIVRHVHRSTWSDAGWSGTFHLLIEVHW